MGMRNEIPVYLTGRTAGIMEASIRFRESAWSEEMQVTAVKCMYGTADREGAREMLKTLSDAEIADSFDSLLASETAPEDHVGVYEALKARREEIMEEYGLGPLEAIPKRRELDITALDTARMDEFTKGVESIPEASEGMEQ